MAFSRLVGLAGLVTMVGSVVFALGLLLSPALGDMRAEAAVLPMFFLLVVAAIVATAILLRDTPRGRLGSLAGAVSLVGLVLVFAGLLMGFLGLLVIPVGSPGGDRWTSDPGESGRSHGHAAVVGWCSPRGGFVPFLLLVFFYFPPLAHPLIGVPWLVVGYANFRAAGRSTESPSRVR